MTISFADQNYWILPIPFPTRFTEKPSCLMSVMTCPANIKDCWRTFRANMGLLHRKTDPHKNWSNSSASQRKQHWFTHIKPAIRRTAKPVPALRLQLARRIFGWAQRSEANYAAIIGAVVILDVVNLHQYRFMTVYEGKKHWMAPYIFIRPAALAV